MPNFVRLYTPPNLPTTRPAIELMFTTWPPGASVSFGRAACVQ